MINLIMILIYTAGLKLDLGLVSQTNKTLYQF